MQPAQRRAAKHVLKRPGVRAGKQPHAAPRRILQRLHIPHIAEFIAHDRLRRHRAKHHLNGGRLVHAAHHIQIRLAAWKKLLPLVADGDAHAGCRQLLRRVAQDGRFAAARRAEQQHPANPPARIQQIWPNAVACPRNVSRYADAHGGR